MDNNDEPLGECKLIPYLMDPEPEELETNLKYTRLLLEKAKKAEAEKAKAALEKIAAKARKEGNLKDGWENLSEKKKYKLRKKPEFRTYPEICPGLFEELIVRNKSDYLEIIKERLFPYINRELEKVILEFIFRRTLAFNKTREKIKYGEFISGTINKTEKVLTKPVIYKRTSIYEGNKFSPD